MVSAARRFFFGGSCAPSSVGDAALRFDGFDPELSAEPRTLCIFSSTLAAGVNGGSAGRFKGTTGVAKGESVGSATEATDGVDSGVAMDEFVSGSE